MDSAHVKESVEQATASLEEKVARRLQRPNLAPISFQKYEEMKNQIEQLETGRAEAEERVQQAEQQVREAKAREEEALKRVDELSGKLASAADATNAETVERLRNEKQDLKTTVVERVADVSRLEQDNAQLRQDAAAARDRVQQLERRLADLQAAEQSKSATESRTGSATVESLSLEAIHQYEERITELEKRLADKDKELRVERIHIEAMDSNSLKMKEDLDSLREKYERRKQELATLDNAYRKMKASEKKIRDELELRTRQFKDASDAAREMEQMLREAQANVNGTFTNVAATPELPSTPAQELMDVDGLPELPSPPSSPVHNDTLRSGQAKVEQENEALRAENERLQAENARYEPFVLTSEQRDSELEQLVYENAALCRSNDRIREEVEELRTLRDRGLLQDLQSASPDSLFPSSELAGMLAQNMTNVFAGIDAVLAETTQRKFTVIDRPPAASTSRSRRQSMVFKQATRPSTPAFAHTGSFAVRSFSAPGQSANTGTEWDSQPEASQSQG